MKANSYARADEIRSGFSAAMSAMYRDEVPAYGTLMALVAGLLFGNLLVSARRNL